MSASRRKLAWLGVPPLAALGIYLYQPALAWLALANTWDFLLQVLGIVPPVMLLAALFDVWVPRQRVESGLGQGSGLRGALWALFLGSAAAGPLFAAFPVAQALRRKGAGVANIVIFLGTWASIKIPMLIMETSFLGLRFALWRLGLTIPCVLAMGWLMNRLLPGDEAGWLASAG